MPLTYRIDAVQRMVFSFGTGVVTDADMITFQAQLRTDPAFHPHFRYLGDLSAVERFAVRPETIHYLAAGRVFDPGVQRAIIATLPTTYTLAGLFQRLTEVQGDNVRVFTDRAAALAWLELAPEPPEHNEQQPTQEPLLQRHHVRLVGDGPQTLILAHGFGTSQQAWRAQVDAFGESYRLVLFDQAGISGTDLTQFDFARYATLDGYVADLLAILDALSLHDAIYVGHSVSGMIGLLAACQQPKCFRSLICIGTSPRYLNDGAYSGGFSQADLDAIYQAMAVDYGGWVLDFAPLAMGNAEQPALAQAFGRSLLSLTPAIARSMLRIMFQSDYRAMLPNVPIPTLIIQSQQDPAVPLSVGEYLAHTIPQATLRLIDARGHLPHVSAPEAVNQAIWDYLRG